jgi:hypothetical protein
MLKKGCPMSNSGKLSVGATVWYMGLDRSIQGEIAINEKCDGRTKVVFRQPQFVTVSPTHHEAGIHESVSVFCEERYIHHPD